MQHAHEQILQIQEQAEQAQQQTALARQQKQQVLDAFRQAVVDVVAERFPKLARSAKKQVRTVEQPERLQHAILRVSIAQDAAEVAQLLLELDEDEEQ